jgi:hypothetical protein
MAAPRKLTLISSTLPPASHFRKAAKRTPGAPMRTPASPAAPAPALEPPRPPAPAPPAPPSLEEYARANPHCRQVRTDLVRPFFVAEAERALRPLDSLPLALTAQSPAMPYTERPDEDRTPLHYGQLKLFLAELRFLTSHTTACTGDPLTVVYAGAAPGHHIPHLARCFPSCQFLLYDPAPFCAELARAPPANVAAHQAFFTEEEATALSAAREGGPAPTPLVFISDVRTGREEDYVEEDMARQEGWVRLLRPAVSMVKFRLPWRAGQTRYLDGDVLLPAYAPLTSTECRLVTSEALALGPGRLYENQEYEQACAFHNTVGRVRCYAHEVALEGLDHCHDCSMFVSLAGEYLRRTAEPATPAAVGAFMRAALAAFGTGRTLATEYARSSNRAETRFPHRSYEGDVLRVAGRGRGGRGPRRRRSRGRAPPRGADADS